MSAVLDESCLFCKIIKKDIPAEVIFESENLLIFKDIMPQAKQHLLAIPKSHFKDFNEFSQSNLFQTFFEGLSEFTKSDLSLKDGFRIVSNCGGSAGQTVFHVHFHLLADTKLGSFGR